MNNLRIYYSGSAYFNCPCSRWDVENYSIIVEIILDKDKRDKLYNNIRPGAVKELFRILGRPVYYDTSFGKNLIKLAPISGTRLYLMHSPQDVYVRSYSETILNSNDYAVKLECLPSGSSKPI